MQTFRGIFGENTHSFHAWSWLKASTTNVLDVIANNPKVTSFISTIHNFCVRVRFTSCHYQLKVKVILEKQDQYTLLKFSQNISQDHKYHMPYHFPKKKKNKSFEDKIYIYIYIENQCVTYISAKCLPDPKRSKILNQSNISDRNTTENAFTRIIQPSCFEQRIFN